MKGTKITLEPWYAEAYEHLAEAARILSEHGATLKPLTIHVSPNCKFIVGGKDA